LLSSDTARTSRKALELKFECKKPMDHPEQVDSSRCWEDREQLQVIEMEQLWEEETIEISVHF
jgi:hypothetical protein